MNNSSQEVDDTTLVSEALEGNRKSLEQLLQKHQSFVYNIAWKMVLNPADAEDITQDIFIKVITGLSGFKGQSQFSTWLYRIAANHLLNLKRVKMENLITTFGDYGDVLDKIPDTDFPAKGVPTPEDLMIIEDAKVGCTAGMLICLDREQRIIFILGEIFEVDHNMGSEILNISKDNFRQKLTRARKDLYTFMREKCGLVNKNNPCRCRKKTRAFIEAGWVDPDNLQFNSHYIKRIYEVAGGGCNEASTLIESQYTEIYRSHPFQEHDFVKQKLSEILMNKEVRKTYNL